MKPPTPTHPAPAPSTPPPTMGRPEAAMRLMRLANRAGMGREDVVAVQVAVRNLQKRHFDIARHQARRRGGEAAREGQEQ